MNLLYQSAFAEALGWSLIDRFMANGCHLGFFIS
jgi:hypothetical protein